MSQQVVKNQIKFPVRRKQEILVRGVFCVYGTDIRRSHENPLVLVYNYREESLMQLLMHMVHLTVKSLCCKEEKITRYLSTASLLLAFTLGSGPPLQSYCSKPTNALQPKEGCKYLPLYPIINTRLLTTTGYYPLLVNKAIGMFSTKYLILHFLQSQTLHKRIIVQHFYIFFLNATFYLISSFRFAWFIQNTFMTL